MAQAFLAGLMALPKVKGLLSSEHFPVDGTLIDAWASMKSFQPRDDDGEAPHGPIGRNTERNFRGEKRSNATPSTSSGLSVTDPDARLYKKADGRKSRLCYMGHVLMENRHGLAVDSTLTHATGTHATHAAGREATLEMIDRRTSKRRITLGADKPVLSDCRRQAVEGACDVTEFIGDLRARNVTPHIAINGTVSKLGKSRKTAIDQRTTRHDGYAMSARKRKRIEEIFGWAKCSAGFARVKPGGKQKVAALFTMAICACNLIGIPKILAQSA